jgi:enoyl-CoA hydratase
MRIEKTEGVAVVHLEAPKANSMGPAFVDGLAALVDELEAALPDAVVFTGRGKIFSAGLDIPALLELDRTTLGAHMVKFNTTMQRIFELPRPVVAAVNGHAIAGGCVLAMQADERWMARGETRIGLTEVTLGIGLPTFVYESFAAQVGPEAIVRGAQQGGLFSPDEAARLGIVYGLEDAESLLDTALRRARELAGLGAEGYAQVKALRRRAVVERTAQHSATDDETWLDTWFSDHAQAELRAVAERLKR